MLALWPTATDTWDDCSRFALTYSGVPCEGLILFLDDNVG